MENINRFNIRVYALCIENQKLLILKEPYVDEILYKFPGGGLEFSEGVIDCLKRELKEELNLEISHFEQFYIQEDFVRSKFKPNEQILTLYYKVEIKDISLIQNIEKSIIEMMWIPLNELSTEHVNLPVDKIVVDRLLKVENLEG